MLFTGMEQAVQILRDRSASERLREDAVRSLGADASAEAITTLVDTLRDNDLGVRWQAAVVLSQLGKRALPYLLSALVDPKRVEDPWLRDGAFHVLRDNVDAGVTMLSRNLRHALKGQAADLRTMREADRLLRILGYENKL
jgi:HEAT repeat protein